MWDTHQPAFGMNGTYNAFSYNKRATDIIHAHDPSTPLFMCHFLFSGIVNKHNQGHVSATSGNDWDFPYILWNDFWFLNKPGPAVLCVCMQRCRYLAWQEAHTPNEVPEEFLSPAGAIDWPLRRTFEGMVHCVDSAIGNVTAALSSRAMWAKTLLVFSSDNGGREDAQFGGNNW